MKILWRFLWIFGYDRNHHKNRYLNKNLRKFASDYSRNSFATRETNFRPEVLIPCYNHGKFLREALASVPVGVPVTIINDASTDETAAIISNLKNDFDFKLITNETNLNQAGSLNRVVQESDNNLFTVLNADDCLLEYSLDILTDLFRRHPTIRLAGGDSIHFTSNELHKLVIPTVNSLDKEPTPRVYTPLDARGYKIQNDINMDMTGCTFLKSAWLAVNGFWEFDKRICSCDDRDFQMRVNALFDVAILPTTPLCLYREDSSLGMGQYNG